MSSEENVVVRLKQRLREARSMGFRIRMELLDDEQATWCEIAGVPTLFVDLSQTTAEQLQQIDETLGQYALQHSEPAQREVSIVTPLAAENGDTRRAA